MRSYQIHFKCNDQLLEFTIWFGQKWTLGVNLWYTAGNTAFRLCPDSLPFHLDPFQNRDDVFLPYSHRSIPYHSNRNAFFEATTSTREFCICKLYTLINYEKYFSKDHCKVKRNSSIYLLCQPIEVEHFLSPWRHVNFCPLIFERLKNEAHALEIKMRVLRINVPASYRHASSPKRVEFILAVQTRHWWELPGSSIYHQGTGI